MCVEFEMTQETLTDSISRDAENTGPIRWAGFRGDQVSTNLPVLHDKTVVTGDPSSVASHEYVLDGNLGSTGITQFLLLPRFTAIGRMDNRSYAEVSTDCPPHGVAGKLDAQEMLLRAAVLALP